MKEGSTEGSTEGSRTNGMYHGVLLHRSGMVKPTDEGKRQITSDHTKVQWSTFRHDGRIHVRNLNKENTPKKVRQEYTRAQCEITFRIV